VFVPTTLPGGKQAPSGRHHQNMPGDGRDVRGVCKAWCFVLRTGPLDLNGSRTGGELRPVTLGPAPAGAPQARLRRGPKLDGASRPPHDRNQGRLGAEGTYGAGQNLQTRVSSSNLFGHLLGRRFFAAPHRWHRGQTAVEPNAITEPNYAANSPLPLTVPLLHPIRRNILDPASKIVE
jgi:hypothetical protein